MDKIELKKLLILNAIGIFLILLALLFHKNTEAESFELQRAESVGYAEGVSAGVKAMYEYSKKNMLFKDSLYFDEERFMNIEDSTVYKNFK